MSHDQKQKQLIMRRDSREHHRHGDSTVDAGGIHEGELVYSDANADPHGREHGQGETKRDEGPTVKVRLQERVFKCPRKALVAASEYFKARLAEEGDSEVFSVPDGVTEDSFLKVLDFVCDRHLEVASDEVPRVMVAASILKMKNLWKMCQNLEPEKIPLPLTQEKIDQWFQWDCRYEAMKREVTYDNRAKKLPFATPSPFDGMRPDEVAGVLRSDWLRAYSEDDVIEALVTWARKLEKLPLRDLQPMMESVRFPLAQLCTQEARFLIEKAGLYEWVVQEAQTYLASPHLQQKFSTRRVLPRFGSVLDAVIFVVGSRIDVSMDGHRYTPRPWSVFAFSLREQLWYEPRFLELRSGGKPLLDSLQRTGSLPVTCSHGNGFYVTSLAEDMPLVHVDALHCRGQRLKGIPRVNKKDQNEVDGDEVDQRFHTKSPFTKDLALYASKHELIASGKSLGGKTHYFNMKVKRWFPTTDEEPGMLQSTLATWERLDQAARTYGQLYGFSEASVKVLLVDDDVVVVDGRGNVSRWEGGDSFTTIAVIPDFHGREHFGVALAGGTVYVMGGVIRLPMGNISLSSDVICVEVKRHPTLTRRLSSATPCPIVHAAFRLIVKKCCIKGRQVAPRLSLT